MTRTSLDPGLFRHRVDLENQVQTPDGCGGFNAEWQLVSRLWAAIEPLSSAQRSQIETLDTLVSYQITIRWRGDCLAQMRFMSSGREFLITSVRDPDETKRYLVCMCEEIK